MVFPLLLILGLLITLIARKLLLNKRHFFQKKKIIMLLAGVLMLLLIKGGINSIAFIISGTIIIAAMMDRFTVLKNKYRQQSDNKMTIDKARQILGVSELASEGEIKDAYHNLIKKNHPDQGGSTFLASQINEAKEILMNNKL